MFSHSAPGYPPKIRKHILLQMFPKTAFTIVEKRQIRWAKKSLIWKENETL